MNKYAKNENVSVSTIPTTPLLRPAQSQRNRPIAPFSWCNNTQIQTYDFRGANLE